MDNVSHTLSPDRAREILEQCRNKLVLVVGDMMLDEFIWGKVRRVSPEAPVPVVEVTNETYCLGGAGNVVSNIRALGGRPLPIGVLGGDTAADRFRSLLTDIGIATEGLLVDDRPTTLKTRVVAQHQQIVRTDREDPRPVSESLAMQLAGFFFEHVLGASTVVISDYDKGVASRGLLNRILPFSDRHNVPVFLDPKVQHADYYRPISVIKPNLREAELLSSQTVDSDASLERAGRYLLDKFSCRDVLITRGEDGMSLFSRDTALHLPTVAREVFDVTGAGDTVIATLALLTAGGATMREAAILANHAAGIAVGKVGTATVSPDELLADLDTAHAHPSG